MKELYLAKNYNEILQYSYDNYVKLDSESMYYLGLSLFELGFLTESRQILKEALYTCDCEKSQPLLYIALSSYSSGLYKESREYLRKASECGGKYAKTANKWQKLLCFHVTSKPLVSLCHHPNINFHFCDKVSRYSCDAFINNYSKSYEIVQNFFNTQGYKKIDVFVFKERKDILGNNLSYANPALDTIHVNIAEDCGHELTHIVSRRAPFDKVAKSDFVQEGVAEYFGNIAWRLSDLHTIKEIDIIDIWSNFRQYDRDFAYAIAKHFFSEILNSTSKEQFLEFFYDQTHTNAKRVFGDSFFIAEEKTKKALKF